MTTLGRYFVALTTAGLFAIAACADEGTEAGEDTDTDTLIVEEDDDDLDDEIGEGIEETGEAIGEGIEETGEAIEEGAEAVNP
jgi:hypothetical protein